MHGGPGCGIAMIVLSVAVVAAGGMAYRYGPWWPWMIVRPHAPGVVIHHSATDAWINDRRVDVELIDRAHERRGWGVHGSHEVYHIGYHYVILPDGTVQQGRPEWMPGAHTSGYNQLLGICLVGDFCTDTNPGGDTQPDRPTHSQVETLVNLLVRLAKKHGFAAKDVHPHSALGATCCPGDRFPVGRVKDLVQKRLE